MDRPVAAYVNPEPDVDYATLDYDQQIQYTQRIKSKVLHKLATSSVDGSVPTDKDGVELLLKVADSMDRTTLSHKKNAIEENTGGNVKDILLGLAAVAQELGNTNPFVGKQGTGKEPAIEELIPEFDHVEGVGEIGVISETVDQFNKRMDSVAEEQRRREAAELGLDIT